MVGPARHAGSLPNIVYEQPQQRGLRRLRRGNCLRPQFGGTLVGAVAVWHAGREGAAAFFRMFERLQVLQLLTVMLVIASATVLALLGILDSNGITGILSGVAGYVLGGLNRPSSTLPPTPKHAATVVAKPA